MNRPRTLRIAHLMGIVAALSLLFSLLYRFREWDLEGRHFLAIRHNHLTWNVGSSPVIDVELHYGYITVIQSESHLVGALIQKTAVANRSQSRANEAVDAISLRTEVNGSHVRIIDSRIIDRSPSRNTWTLRTDTVRTNVELHVPPGAQLNLVTDEGDIYLGFHYIGAQLYKNPLVIQSVKAATHGRFYNKVYAEFASPIQDPDAPISVDLTSDNWTAPNDGVIIVNTNHSTVNASLDGNHVFFYGRFGPGKHVLNATKKIEILVPNDISFRVKAKSQGFIHCDFPSLMMVRECDKDREFLIGNDPIYELHVSSENGPIRIGEH